MPTIKALLLYLIADKPAWKAIIKWSYVHASCYIPQTAYSTAISKIIDVVIPTLRDAQLPVLSVDLKAMHPHILMFWKLVLFMANHSKWLINAEQVCGQHTQWSQWKDKYCCPLHLLFCCCANGRYLLIVKHRLCCACRHRNVCRACCVLFAV